MLHYSTKKLYSVNTLNPLTKQDNLMFDIALKNFIKGVAKKKFTRRLNSYSVLYTFLIKFDQNIKLTKQNFNNLQRRNTSFKLFIETSKTKNFIDYIQNLDPSFKEYMILPEDVYTDDNKQVHIAYSTPDVTQKVNIKLPCNTLVLEDYTKGGELYLVKDNDSKPYAEKGVKFSAKRSLYTLPLTNTLGVRYLSTINGYIELRGPRPAITTQL